MNACRLCLVDAESIDHLILKCKVSQVLWKSVLGWFLVAGFSTILYAYLKHGEWQWVWEGKEQCGAFFS